MAVEAAGVDESGFGKLRPSVWWNLGMSSYWFATSFKWFILLNGLLASRVDKIVPGGDESAMWGLIVAIGSLEAMIGPIVFGVLSDRVRSLFGRRRPFIAVGAAMTTIALFFLSGANSIPGMIAAYLLLQISDDIGTAPYAAIIPDLVHRDHRGRASGIMALLQQLAQIFAAITGLALGANPMLLFAVIAGLNLVCAVIVLVTVKEPSYPLREKVAFNFSHWLGPWRSADFRWVWFTRFLNSIGFYLILLYLLFYLKDNVQQVTLFGMDLWPPEARAEGRDPSQAQIAVALLLSLVAATSAVIAGKRADAIGRKRVIVRAGYVMFAALMVFAIFPDFTMIFLLAGVFGIGYGAYLSSDWALVADVLPDDENVARDMGMWSISVPLGQTVAGFAGYGLTVMKKAGLTYQMFGKTLYVAYPLMFLVAAVFFLLSTVLVRQVRGST